MQTYSLCRSALVGGGLDGHHHLFVAGSAVSDKDYLTVSLWHGNLLFVEGVASWGLDDANICSQKVSS